MWARTVWEKPPCFLWIVTNYNSHDIRWCIDDNGSMLQRFLRNLYLRWLAARCESGVTTVRLQWLILFQAPSKGRSVVFSEAVIDLRRVQSFREIIRMNNNQLYGVPAGAHGWLLWRFEALYLSREHSRGQDTVTAFSVSVGPSWPQPAFWVLRYRKHQGPFLITAAIITANLERLQVQMSLFIWKAAS